MVGEEWHWPERGTSRPAAGWGGFVLRRVLHHPLRAGTSRAPKRSRPTAKGNVLCRTEIHPRFAIHVDPEHQIGRLRAV
jgi:hypothetical protein